MENKSRIMWAILNDKINIINKKPIRLFDSRSKAKKAILFEGDYVKKVKIVVIEK